MSAIKREESTPVSGETTTTSSSNTPSIGHTPDPGASIAPAPIASYAATPSIEPTPGPGVGRAPTPIAVSVTSIHALAGVSGPSPAPSRASPALAPVAAYSPAPEVNEGATPSYYITPQNAHSPFPRNVPPRQTPAPAPPPAAGPPPDADPTPADPPQGRKHLTNDERIRVRTLFFDAGFTKNRIQRHTQYTLKQIRTALRSPTVGKRPGRPTNMTPEQDRELADFVGASRENATLSYQRIADTVLGGEFGVYTIRNAFRRLGYQRVNGVLRPAPKGRKRPDEPEERDEGAPATWNSTGLRGPNGRPPPVVATVPQPAEPVRTIGVATRDPSVDGRGPEELAAEVLGRAMAEVPASTGVAAGELPMEEDEASEDDEDEDMDEPNNGVGDPGARGSDMRETRAEVTA